MSAATDLDLPSRLTPTQRRIIVTLAEDGGEIAASKRSLIAELVERLDVRSRDTLRMNIRRLERARLIECHPKERPRAIRLTSLGRAEAG